MKKTSKTIVFFGNERLATGVSTEAQTLEILVSAGYKVAAVVSNYERGLSRNPRSLEITDVTKKYNIPIWLPKKTSEIINELRNLNADIGVLVAYGKIVPETVINIFPCGIVNIHPSLLPHYRGPTPIEQAILDGSVETGVSLMRLIKTMDAGPVYAQKALKLNGDETKQDLADKLLKLGGSMLLDILPDILVGKISAHPQDHSLATYDNLITKKQGKIDFHKPAWQIEREVRAFLGWPQSRFSLKGTEIIITRASVADYTGDPGTLMAKNNELILYCKENALRLERLKPAGKRDMSAQEFLSGHKHLL